MPKKQTKEEIIIKAQKVHGDKYDYSLVIYNDMHKDIIIICPEHGEFNQQPSNHLQGKGCKECGRISTTQKQRLSPEQVINKCKEKHNDKIDVWEYHPENIVNMKTICNLFYCKLHKCEVDICPEQHCSQKGGGCPDCTYNRAGADVTERVCCECNLSLPLTNFEKGRTNCTKCRGRKLKDTRIEKGIVDPRDLLITKTRLEECNNMCQDCGLNNPELLTFDHLEPENKLLEENGNKTKKFRNLSINKLKNEIVKPHKWLCFNCHKIKTDDTTPSKTACHGTVLNRELKLLLGNNCELCDESRLPTICFDHIIEENKEFTIGDEIQQLRFRLDNGMNTDENTKSKINKICNEVKKCGLLCFNCNWLKNNYKLFYESKHKLPKVFYNTPNGKLWVDKLENYKQRDRKYNIDEDDLFELVNTYKNEIIGEKFAEHSEYGDSKIYTGLLKDKITWNQYGIITVSDFILHLTSVRDKMHNTLPKYIYYYNNKTGYKVENLTIKVEYFKTLEEAVTFKNNVILDDVVKRYGIDSQLYTYTKSLLTSIEISM